VVIEISIIVDANGNYTVDEALASMRRTIPCG
jgi:L-alanine-DL-glutamate epimerase-like enolase superfamily enzyme